jgi:hypothetical protein
MSISQIRNPWVRRPLVVVYGAPYVVVMTLLAILAGFLEGVMYAYEYAAEFLDDLFGPLRSAWRGRRG